jgi:hypothetical protein
MVAVTVEVDEAAYERARVLAKYTGKSIEQVLANSMNRYGHEPSIEQLRDEEVLKIADSKLSQQQQEELDMLLTLGNAGKLESQQKAQLDELLEVYRLGQVRKALAMKEAVERGLCSQNLDEWALFKDK